MILFEPKVHLVEETHRYFHNDTSEEYDSVSKVLGTLKQDFDREGKSLKSAEKRGISQEEVLKEWDEKRDKSANHGTRIHKAIEVFKTIGRVPEEFKDLKVLVQALMKEYSDYYRLYSELIVYSDLYRIAGTIDQPMLVSQHKNSAIDIDDFKTNVEKGIQFFNPYGGYCKDPYGYLPDCNFVHYSFQLSIYAYLVQELTGRKIRRLNIMFIPPNDPLAFRRIPVIYMRREAEELIKNYRLFNPIGGKQTAQNYEPNFE